jgi:glyoxylase-like metal-dependent hydrolase (beta-lactamase superfamily II)
MSEPTASDAADTPILETIVVGALQANCYLLVCPSTREAAIVDPGDQPDDILAAVAQHAAHVSLIVHTHGHFDHISATEAVLARLPAPVPVAAHPADHYLYAADEQTNALAAGLGYPIPATRAMPTVALQDESLVTVGTLELRVLHTPGHTPGSLCLLCEPSFLLSGDTLFRRGIGRTDLAGGDEDAIYRSIEARLYPLRPDLVVYPGHGAPTTIADERRLNPFVRA